MISSNICSKSYQISHSHLVCCNTLSLNQSTIQTVFIGLFRRYPGSICIKFVIEAIFTFNYKLIGLQCVTLNQVTFDSHTDQFSGNSLIADHYILNETRLGIEFLHSCHANVGEINVCILQICICSIKLFYI